MASSAADRAMVCESFARFARSVTCAMCVCVCVFVFDVCVCVCVFVFVYERVREGREKEKEKAWRALPALLPL